MAPRIRGAPSAFCALFVMVILFAGCGKSEPKVNAHDALIRKLAELESVLETGSASERINQCIIEIGAEDKLKPLTSDGQKTLLDRIRWGHFLLQLDDQHRREMTARWGSPEGVGKSAQRVRETRERTLRDFRNATQELREMLLSPNADTLEASPRPPSPD